MLPFGASFCNRFSLELVTEVIPHTLRAVGKSGLAVFTALVWPGRFACVNDFLIRACPEQDLCA